jgi:multidrug efflux pump subunit AcrA (membrane-fusion protein)
MKNKWVVVLLILVILTGCSAAKATPTPVATVNLDSGKTSANQAAGSSSSSGSGANASGILVPLKEAKIGTTSTGYVSGITVQLGDDVKSGQVLANLSGKDQAQAELSAAKQAIITAQNDLDQFNRQAPVVTAQTQKDLAAAQRVMKTATDKLANLKHMRMLYDKKWQEEIKKIESSRSINLNNPTDQDIAEAEANLAYATAQVTDLTNYLVKVKDGPDPDQLALLQSKVKSAQDQAVAAKSNLDNLELKSPFDGTISAVNVSEGDMASPGQVLFMVTDSSRLRVETTDLSERDVAAIKTGSKVSVLVKPLGKTVPGTVVAVSSQAETVGGDVVYRTVIDLDNIPEGARAGMSVEVDF